MRASPQQARTAELDEVVISPPPRRQALIWRANYHPDGGQLFYPLHGESYVVPLALPGDDVRPESFTTF